MKYKVIDGSLTQEPASVQIGDIVFHPAPADWLQQNKYKDLVVTEQPIPLWFQQVVKGSLTEDDTTIFQNWDIAPVDNIKEVHRLRVNGICDIAIATGFIYEFQGVQYTCYLDLEATTNFGNAYTRAKLLNKLPVELKIGFNSWVTFTTLEEIEDFYTKAGDWLEQCLANCWPDKKLFTTMTDKEVYNWLLNNDSEV